ncbi:MAG: hypothetical protein H5U00_05960 [Clostridia bacterium]|nr:hypothetical protein [Clostridia bacterium]
MARERFRDRARQRQRRPSGAACPWLAGGKDPGVRLGGGEPKAAPGMEACPQDVLGSAVKVTLEGQPHLEDYRSP